MKQATVLPSAALLLSAAVSLFAQSTAVKSRADVSKAGMDPERLARIHARMKEFVDKGTSAGAVMLVARHGVVASLEAVGYQDLETKTPMRTDTIFQIRSMTKPITAVGIMILLEEGRLLLNDPVEKHVPEFREQLVVDQREGQKVLSTKKPSRRITIRDLLTHTSGLPADVGPEESVYRASRFSSGQASDTSGFSLQWHRTNKLGANVAAYTKSPLEFEPGTKLLYSNAGFATLGRIIEVASGQSYEEFVEKRILRPLGMKDTFFFPPPEKYNRIATAYGVENGKLKRLEGARTPAWASQGADAYPAFVAFVQYARPSSGLFSTASDMAAFLQMMLNGGTYNGVRILSRASVEAMTVSHIENLPTIAGGTAGLGWVVRVGPQSALFSTGAFGHGGGLGTFGWVDPKKDLVGVFLNQESRSQSEGWADTVRDTFFGMTYAAIAGDLKSTR